MKFTKKWRLATLCGLLFITGLIAAVWVLHSRSRPLPAPSAVSQETKSSNNDGSSGASPGPNSSNQPTQLSTTRPASTGTSIIRTDRPNDVISYAQTHDLSITEVSVLPAGQALVSIAQKPDEPTLQNLVKSVPGSKVGASIIYRALATPNDPNYPQWYTDKISAPAAWDITTGSSAVNVAVMDTGFSMNHEDLLNRWAVNSGESGAGKESNGVDDDANGKVDDWRGWDFIADDNNPSSTVISHGTEVAGLVGAESNNAKGVASINWQSPLLPLRVLDNTGSGTTDELISALAYARAMGIKVANLSLGSTLPDSLLEDEINSDIAAGMTIVAAAGNCGDSDSYVFNNCDAVGQIVYPANYPGVIAVGATDSNDNRTAFSSYGPNLDIMAPGAGTIQTPTTAPGNSTTAYSSTVSGTSFAAPIVSGAAALMYAYLSGMTPSQIAVGITGSADKVSAMNGATRSDQYGYGRLNALEALRINRLACPNTVLSNYNVSGATTGEHVLANRLSSSGPDRLSILQPNNTGTGCIEIYTWADNLYQNWIQLTATNSPAMSPADVKLLTADGNGDGNDELYKVDYCGASGMIEVHGWLADNQHWASHIATNRPCISSANAEVIAADANGDGRDELYLIEYQNNGSGRVEVHGWNGTLQGWVSHTATNYGQVDPGSAQVITADTNGNRQDEFYLVNYSGSSNRVEVHGWTPNFQQWVSHIATNSWPALHVDGSNNPISDVITADTNGDGRDEFFKIDYTGTNSHMVEVHGWTADLQGWLVHTATSHGEY